MLHLLFNQFKYDAFNISGMQIYHIVICLSWCCRDGPRSILMEC